MTIDKRIGDIEGKNILLLQGPMGKFFNKLYDKFTDSGAKVFRVGLNAGDWLFAHNQNYYAYKGAPKEWEFFISNFYKKHKIDIVLLFGDCRFYHRIAIQIAKKAGIDVYVFEEGYLRPGFITMEYFGVNAHSQIPKNKDFYENYQSPNENLQESPFTYSTYGRMAWWAFWYYVVGNAFHFMYPNYIHHRDFYAIKECFYGLRNCYRKYLNKILEFGFNKKLNGELSNMYYFVPLQVREDFQIRKNSHFKDVEEFIVFTMKSFVKHAPKHTKILFKHHPMDRGKKNYKKFIIQLAQKLGIENRVLVAFDIHLPTALKNSIAVVTINSTVGLSALLHSKPTICLGSALYDIDGLTSKGMSLDRFWREYKEVDSELYKKFRQYLLDETQIYGSFYLAGSKMRF